MKKSLTEKEISKLLLLADEIKSILQKENLPDVEIRSFAPLRLTRQQLANLKASDFPADTEIDIINHRKVSIYCIVINGANSTVLEYSKGKYLEKDSIGRNGWPYYIFDFIRK